MRGDERIDRAVRLIDENAIRLRHGTELQRVQGHQWLLTQVMRELLGDRFHEWLGARAEAGHPWDQGSEPPRPVSL